MLHTVFYVIVFLLTLVFSNVANKIFPKLPLPLIQVLMGLLLGVLGADKVLTVDPQIFLAFIIAPLLFREAEEAEVKRIFGHTKIILVLIFPLVFLTAFGVGVLTHFLYAAVPLAAAVALGGTLAPTDAVVVSALSNRFTFSRRLTSILKGEGLLNDASGIISFQIAVTALITGTFSFASASLNLFVTAIGGALVGMLLVWVSHLILTVLEDVAAQDTVGYLMLELAVPLAAYFIADVLQFSGIIAVVVAGVMQANGLRRTSLFDAQLAKVKNTIWETLTFVLNSVVFIFLGIELYQLIAPVLAHNAYSNAWLLIMVISLTAALFLIRFIVLVVYYFIEALRLRRKFASTWHSILLLTFSGAKGTIGMATILLLPRTATAHATLLIFLCAAVTGLSFLVSLFVIPLLSAPRVEKVDNLTKINMLAEVVKELEADQAIAGEKTGYTVAIDGYQERIQRLIIEQESATISTDFNDLQLLIMRIETEGLERALSENTISMYTYRIYQRYIHSLEQTVVHHLVSSVQFALAVIGRGLHMLLARLLHVDFGAGNREKVDTEKTRQEITELYFSNTELVLQSLENLDGVYDEQLIHFLQSERLRTASFVADGGHITRMVNKTHPNNLSEMMRGYYLERKLIFEYENSGELTSKEAQEMRQAVNVMEDYSIAGQQPSLLTDFLARRRG